MNYVGSRKKMATEMVPPQINYLWFINPGLTLLTYGHLLTYGLLINKQPMVY